MHQGIGLTPFSILAETTKMKSLEFVKSDKILSIYLRKHSTLKTRHPSLNTKRHYPRYHSISGMPGRKRHDFSTILESTMLPVSRAPNSSRCKLVPALALAKNIDRTLLLMLLWRMVRKEQGSRMRMRRRRTKRKRKLRMTVTRKANRSSTPAPLLLSLAVRAATQVAHITMSLRIHRKPFVVICVGRRKISHQVKFWPPVAKRI
mmetsp:Transcript_13238/g.22063  ORF Transcript_13238/g.22063 Transcript_13238/m.22063 type:complete len:205 (-) Transcript_13238:325-939(-)